MSQTFAPLFLEEVHTVEGYVPMSTDEHAVSIKKAMDYAHPPKCAEFASLFKPEYPITPEEERKLQEELEVQMQGFSEIYPLKVSCYSKIHNSRSHTSPKYAMARDELLKKKSATGDRFGVQFIVGSSDLCRNIEEKELLIHDENGEYIKVVYGKIVDVYDYEMCVNRHCDCAKPKPQRFADFEDTDSYDISTGLLKKNEFNPITLDQLLASTASHWVEDFNTHQS